MSQKITFGCPELVTLLPHSNLKHSNNQAKLFWNWIAALIAEFADIYNCESEEGPDISLQDLFVHLSKAVTAETCTLAMDHGSRGPIGYGDEAFYIQNIPQLKYDALWQWVAALEECVYQHETITIKRLLENDDGPEYATSMCH
ncbi:unnamed protein product [Orchesella dallaii]|uniref:Uncharacterized protein n=1 Tax=Orchesella dallaii TaxID=48710 RepID=A0ABP1PTP7_9HEXA